MRLKILSGNDVKKAVSMAQAISAVKEAYIQLSSGKAEMPLRTSVPVEKQKGITLFMPSYLAESQAMGAKVVSVFPQNLDKGMPTIHAVVVVLDAETGRPVALLDGTYLTALRTGAASGAATDLLARNDARVAAIFGAGAQARTQLVAVCTVRTVEKVWIFDTQPGIAEAWAAEMKFRGSPIPSAIFVAESPAQAAREADIICTATTSYEPVFEDKDLKPGVHINAIGAYTPDMKEIPVATVIRSKLIVDSRQACLAEAGDIIIPLKDGLIAEEHIHGEIGDVAAGRIPGRESDEEVTLFKSVGLAVQDVAVAELVRAQAEEMNLGFEVDI
ncbi:MAG: ornithine cyclodeaminase family protein [Candidatus Aminicenantaceae bacterium]